MNKVIGLIFVISVSCSPTAGPHKPLVAPPEPPPVTQATIDYSQVRPIFAEHCTACHPSRSAPNWLDYPSAFTYVRNGILERRVITEKSMPPPGSREAALMTEADRDLIANWISDGAPETAIVETEQAGNGEPHSVVRSCLDCHGVEGPQLNSRHDIPKLGGQNGDYLEKQLTDFKWFGRIDPSYEMNKQAMELTDREIIEISAYFANSKSMGETSEISLPSDRREAFEVGRAVAMETCNSCHMSETANFRPINSLIPILVGQNEQYITNQLIYFQIGLRKNELMESLSKELTREEIVGLSVYFSFVNPLPSAQSSR